MSKDEEPAIIVKDLHKSFKLPHEQRFGIKQAAVNIFNIHRGYEEQKVLKGVSFEIKKGEFFGIVGRNGSGKSTLLKLLAGIYAPDKGLVQVNGSLTPFIELGVGFNPELTGRENVFLNGALLGFSRDEMLNMYDSIVEFAELENFMDQKLKNYSSGMQVRLAFSIAIRADSDVLVLDEVLAVGDSAFQQKCFDYFETLKTKGKTVVLVTHDMSAVKRFCSKALLVEGGNIKVSGSPEEVADQYLLDNIAGSDGSVKSQSMKHKFNKQVDDLNLKIISRDHLNMNNTLEIKINYKLKVSVNTYLGFKISSSGISIAEMNSIDEHIKNTPNKEHVVYSKISLNTFNPGVYKIDIAIFNKKNRGLLGYRSDCAQFVVEGKEIKYGGAMRVDASWEVE